KKIGASRLSRTAQPAPDVYFEGEQAQRGGSKRSVLRRYKRRRQGRCAIARGSNGSNIRIGPEVRELVGSRYAECGARRLDPRCRVSQIVVLLQSLAFECLELFVLEDLPPFKIA